MNPIQEYERRLAEYRARENALEGRMAWTGNGRFLLFAWTGGQVFLTIFLGRAWLPLLAIPLAGFIGFSLAFERARRHQARLRQASAWYDLGLARLQDRWHDLGTTGEEFADPDHLYAADLDLLGHGSLYQRLCDARTRPGRHLLAGWLLNPAEPAAIRRRQEAVADLRDRLDWREGFVLAGAFLPDGIASHRLAEWGAVPTEKPEAWPGWIAPLVAAATLGTLGAWLVAWFDVRHFAAALAVQILFALYLRPRVLRALDGVKGRSRDLLPLVGILRCLENETFRAPLLVELQERLRSSGEPPSQRLAELAQYIARLDARQNTFFALLAPFFLWTTRVGLQVQEWRFHTGPSLPLWVPLIAEAEALVSLAGYAFENPEDPFPEIVDFPEGDQDKEPLLQGESLGHPLLPRATAVRNDVDLGPHRRLLLISGSNMSGKSTYLRTIGTNVALALAGAPVPARRLRLTPLAIGATLRIQDSLEKGKSRFYAEICRIRAIVERGRGEIPLLFLLDEILHGTNSHDRRLGTESILEGLLSRPSLGLVTTHDLAITAIVDRLDGKAANVHFSDNLVDGRMEFDYRLHVGVVQHSNALALMRAVGLAVEDRNSHAS